MTAVMAREQVCEPATQNEPVDELVRVHLPLVGHLVREMLGRIPSHVCRDDLVSAGMLALVTSAQSYDASRGVPFGRFAAIRIRGALTDELRTMDWASRGVRSKARELETARGELAAALGRTPRREEIAHAMGIAVSELDGVEADVQRASVLSIQGLTDNDGAELLPSVGDGPEALLLRREQLGLLRDAIAELPDRLRVVVEEYFFEQRKMADIAADLGVTESRVSQLRSEALAMLRDGMRAQDSAAGDAPRTSAGARKRNDAREAYAAAIAARSNLAGRLEASSLLGEARTVVRLRNIRTALYRPIPPRRDAPSRPVGAFPCPGSPAASAHCHG
jgi:RNA polymerase sigma factor for flagellar operon FliA